MTTKVFPEQLTLLHTKLDFILYSPNLLVKYGSWPYISKRSVGAFFWCFDLMASGKFACLSSKWTLLRQLCGSSFVLFFNSAALLHSGAWRGHLSPNLSQGTRWQRRRRTLGDLEPPRPAHSSAGSWPHDSTKDSEISLCAALHSPELLTRHDKC